MRQHKYTAETERVWEVDLAAASTIQAWASRAAALLEQEVAEMAEHLPHWLLCLGRNGRPQPCADCGDLIVFAEAAARCVACWRPVVPVRGDCLVWTGHLPAVVRDAPQLLARLAALGRDGMPLASTGNARFLIVPLMLAYPDQWPQLPPSVRYPASFLRNLELPAASAEHHLIGDGIACLYAHGDWRAVTARVVIQQRVVNHLASLLKIAAGQTPRQAFIGRAH